MRAYLNIYCDQCRIFLGKVHIDTADLPRDLQQKINRVVLEHRQECKLYDHPRQAEKPEIEFLT